jgi:hypothetical protein
MNHSDWYSIYTAALLELDPAKLSTRIRDAEAAIFLRAQNLGDGSDSVREREAITDALSSLRSLQRNMLRELALGQTGSSLLT